MGCKKIGVVHNSVRPVAGLSGLAEARGRRTQWQRYSSSTGASTISESFDNANNFALAQQIANALAAASKAGTLNVTTASSTSVPPPPPNPGGINELIIATGGDYTIPGGTPPGSPDWVVILDSTAPVTIHGSPNMSVWGGLNTDTIIDPAAIVFSEFAGDAAVTVSGIGDVVAGNNHNNTIAAAGANDTISAGAGNNVLSSTGAANVIFAGPGIANITSSGDGSQIGLGSGLANVTLTGGAASVFGIMVHSTYSRTAPPVRRSG